MPNDEELKVADDIEKVSAEIHRCYCRAYERRFGRTYWTGGDYSKLDEPTKNYDREMARWHIEQMNTRPLEGKQKLDEDSLLECISTVLGPMVGEIHLKLQEAIADRFRIPDNNITLCPIIDCCKGKVMVKGESAITDCGVCKGKGWVIK